MKQPKENKTTSKNFSIPKSPSGITGLDEITLGGFPRNRSTLIMGGSGCGKTIMAMEFLNNGIDFYNEPGVFMTFEENKDDLVLNVKSLGYDLKKYIEDNSLCIDQVRINTDELDNAGMYDLEGIFVRLDRAIKTVNAKRVALDSLDKLFRISEAIIVVKKKGCYCNNYFRSRRACPFAQRNY